MNTVVTARVPQEIKAQVDQRLKEMGSSTTELINQAYEYVLKKGTLPIQPEAKDEAFAGEKRLSPEMTQQFREKWGQIAVLGSGYDGTNFKELLDDARGEYYARFA